MRAIMRVALSRASPRVWRKVLVKCRQNVANKLFITRVFNPVRPYTWLTALSALLKELASTSQRERACLDLTVIISDILLYENLLLNVHKTLRRHCMIVDSNCWLLLA